MMSVTEAELFQRLHDADARMLTRMSKNSLRTVFIRNMTERGIESLSVKN
jgi:hypothetical protein